MTLLRWPGGNFASGYNWKDGIGPRDQRPVRRDHAWGALETNRFGTDDFLTYCETLKVEPYLCINAGLGSVEDARNWVDYTNERRTPTGRSSGARTAATSRGTSRSGASATRSTAPGSSATRTPRTTRSSRSRPRRPCAASTTRSQLIASGSSNFGPGADWVGWNRTVLERLKNEIDYISLHTYVGNRTNNFEEFLALRPGPRRPHRGREGPDPGGAGDQPAGAPDLHRVRRVERVVPHARARHRPSTRSPARGSRSTTTSRTRSGWVCS